MIRFLADASLRDAIVTGCRRREPAVDFLSANDASLSDPEVLALAAAQGRILVTSDWKTMPRHFGEFLAARGTSAGVFLVRQGVPVVDVIEALLLVWGASEAEEWKDRILEIPQP
jgi:predicted nuclease of predicted toxin-antitoxin system